MPSGIPEGLHDTCTPPPYTQEVNGEIQTIYSISFFFVFVIIPRDGCLQQNIDFDAISISVSIKLPPGPHLQYIPFVRQVVFSHLIKLVIPYMILGYRGREEEREGGGEGEGRRRGGGEGGGGEEEGEEEGRRRGRRRGRRMGGEGGRGGREKGEEGERSSSSVALEFLNHHVHVPLTHPPMLCTLWTG